jgi:hypothetical protein
VRAGLLDDRGHEPPGDPSGRAKHCGAAAQPGRRGKRRGHDAGGDQPGQQVAASPAAPSSCSRSAPTPSTTSSPDDFSHWYPSFTRCRIQRRARRSLSHFVPLSYDCRGVPASADVGDVSRMRQHVSDSLKRHRHTQTSPSGY